MENKNIGQIYQRRIDNLRKAMLSDKLDALLIYGGRRGQVRYISGYHPNYSANLGLVFFPRIGNPAMIIRFPFDLDRAQRESWITDVEASGDVLGLALRVVHIIRQNNLVDGRIGLVTGDHVINEMSYDVYNRLKQELPDAKFVDASYLFDQARLLKSDMEFENLRRSAKVVDQGTEVVQEILQPGRSEYEIVAAVESRMRVLGAGMCLVSITSKGISESIGPPKARLLEPGDTVLMAIAAKVSGYTTQVARTFVVGTPKKAQIEIYQATLDAYMAGISAARVGNQSSDIATAIQETVKSKGYEPNFDHDMGHGIGIDLPEAPNIDFTDHTIIKPGFVLVIHPSIHVPSIRSAFVGGTVLVHRDHVEAIHQIPTSLN